MRHPFENHKPPWNDSQPIRAELFGIERFREHAQSLARSQTATVAPVAVYSVVRRLSDDSAALVEAYQELSAAVAAGKAVTPAAEWLIDNFHLIEEHAQQAAADLPQSFYRQLPKIAAGPLAGHPRIFGVAWAYVAHTDSRFDAHALTEFINAYQEVQPLSIGELWAVAISLRLVMIENLARISTRNAKARRAREAADDVADRLLDRRAQIADLETALAPGTAQHAELSFAVQLIKQLRDRDAVDAAVLDWLRHKVTALGHDFESAVAEEHHRQAAANVTMRNLVTSLRLMADYNWEDWFEGVSSVDKLLRTYQPYGEMDFRTRNDYRNAVEDLSQHSDRDEHAVARLALDRAASAAEAAGPAARDPGYNLVGPGRTGFEASIGYRPPLRRRISDGVRGAGLPGYLGAILVLAALVLGFGLWPLAKAGLAVGLLILLALLGLGAAFETAMAMVNYAITQMLRPVVVPGLALRDGVPAQLRSLVTIPALLTSHADIEELVERLEVHYLANSTGELYFALLTDWTDADTEKRDGDDALLTTALDGIARLNRQYGQDRFLLLHRARRWNEQQGKWMGWERKRGKLHELNRLLRGATETSFTAVGGMIPPDVRFVITLDADTKLPRDAARRLVGKLAHPLNRPLFDPRLGRVTEGYGILQPRVTPSLPAIDNGSAFQRIFSSRRGSDPYVFAVSDVYQDLFGEGSYAGKGIYDVDAFEAALAGRIPENTMLSHDLFEGNLVRAALVSDIEVVEEYPGRYATAAARQHRWVRGDWQLLPWIVGLSGKSPPALGRWKMIDNLRRSLNPVLTLLALLAGWLWLPGALAAAWTAFIVFANLVPSLLPVFSGSSLRHSPITIASQLRVIASDVAHSLVMTAANLAFLGHQAGLMADAIVRTLYRLFASRRNLLEWTTAAQVESSTRPGLTGTYHLMLASLAAGAVAIAIAAVRGDGPALPASMFALLWFAAPAIAWWISQPNVPADELAASHEDRLALRLVARRTWTFFETFVTAGDNMLPPDNFQEDPKPVVAHRTSPTNIGLYLLSTACAREFGWLGLGDAVGRIEATLGTLDRMEKCRGHLFNWYDTETLVPLEPRYVSAVDSGNLAGHLLALANICGQWLIQPAGAAHYLDGIGDAAEILREELAAMATGKPSHKKAFAHVEQLLAAFGRATANARTAPELLPVRLIDLAVQANAIHDSVLRIAAALEAPKADEAVRWANILRDAVESQLKDAVVDPVADAGLRKRLESIAAAARSYAVDMEFGFLNDPQRNLLSIGYRVADGSLDEGCYDMLASEASLASFFAIAKGDLRARHWFRLARPVTALPGGAALVSWSGSMFEYLMPALVLRAPAGSLIEQSERLIVRRQIDYGNSIGIPWGISESAFSARDVQFTYQYSNFGVPGLGLKRGLSDNLVIAPYATGLASMVAPRAAAANFSKLAKAGGRGRHGFYEALDFTPQRLRGNDKVAVVRAYFAHHQGMTIAAILNAVNNNYIRAQFHGEPMVRATELLLQERSPRQIPVALTSAAAASPADITRALIAVEARNADPRSALSPATHLLSNGQYAVMITASGTGYSTFNGIAINRWREDLASDGWGTFIYLRDVGSGAKWTAGYMPAIAEPVTYNAVFNEEKVEIHRTDGPFATTLECLVSTEDNAEARRVSIVNTGKSARIVEVTAYVELALAPAAADSAHPAFSKLFVETEYAGELESLLATRRRRQPADPEIWVAQFMLVNGSTTGELDFETSRMQFIGRGNDISSAAAMADGRPLGKTTGTVLDPVFALRRRLRIPPGQQVSCTLWTVVADSRESVLDLVDRYRQHAAYERAQILAWTQSRIALRHLSIDAESAALFQRLASYLIFADEAFRPASHIIRPSIRPQSTLWPQSISGTKPILLARIDAIEDIDFIRQLLRAHEYWSAKRLAVDLVILNDRRASYMQDLQAAIEDLVRKTRVDTARDGANGSGQIYALRADLLPQETLAMLPAVARAVVNAAHGSLATQLERAWRMGAASPTPRPASRPVAARPAPLAPPAEDLAFFNGYGGFDEARGEYVLVHDGRKPTPAPWINVIANPSFGTHCAGDGGGYTWTGNSRECQITGWSNDPVGNRPGEAIYVRDEQSGLLTGPCLAPLRHGRGTYRTRHGFGYTRFEAEDDGLRMAFTQFVPLDSSVKIGRLRIVNDSGTARQLSVTFYAELVLGTSRASSAPFVTTEIDGETGALFARNRWNADFGERVIFADLLGRQTSWTGDRLEFHGRYGNLAAPRALATGDALSNRTGGGLDPCAALQQKMALAAGESVEVTILLGAAASDADARALIGHCRAADPDQLLSEIKAFWAATLGAVKVRTPDRAFDLMLNGWLLYQTLACRMWGRSGFYQASGAFGFRDQLQDGMALAAIRPDIARRHILLAASRQFAEGDVQHWWLPANGMGVRTRISDDTVWLAHCVLHYIKTTGDTAILDESVTFLDGRQLEDGEHDAFYQPTVPQQTATLYEHCVLGIERNLPAGAHGLPLIGTGDWNDGMNRVGEQGRGESVWLGWFLYATLKAFEPIVMARGDRKRSAIWRKRLTGLQQALDEHGWDGNWYRRGYFDDGSPLGSALNAECRIDAIAQSWAVLSGAAKPERAALALDEAYRQLVKPEDGIAMLFTPPFDTSLPDPGYVKAYPPGIRENGGQYTHGAIWSIFAHAELGQSDKAHALFALINPVNHARTEAEVRRYMVEPYVVAADVYSVPPHVGRGGWTWYTGAAGWLYRAGMEAILGITREGNKLRVKPCMPLGWNEFHVSLQFGATRYEIDVRRGLGGSSNATPHVRRLAPGEFLIDLHDAGGTTVIALDVQPAAEENGTQAVA